MWYIFSLFNAVKNFNIKCIDFLIKLLIIYLEQMFVCCGAIMIDVYKKCPVFEDLSYTLRMVNPDDCLDLLRVYSDVKAVPLFNSDNCGGDDFITPQKTE